MRPEQRWGSHGCLGKLAERIIKLPSTNPFTLSPRTNLLLANFNLALPAQDATGMRPIGETGWRRARPATMCAI